MAFATFLSSTSACKAAVRFSLTAFINSSTFMPTLGVDLSSFANSFFIALFLLSLAKDLDEAAKRPVGLQLPRVQNAIQFYDSPWIFSLHNSRGSIFQLLD